MKTTEQKLAEAYAMIKVLSAELRETIDVHVWGDDEPDDDGRSYETCDLADAWLDAQ